MASSSRALVAPLLPLPRTKSSIVSNSVLATAVFERSDGTVGRVGDVALGRLPQPSRTAPPDAPRYAIGADGVSVLVAAPPSGSVVGHSEGSVAGPGAAVAADGSLDPASRERLEALRAGLDRRWEGGFAGGPRLDRLAEDSLFDLHRQPPVAANDARSLLQIHDAPRISPDEMDIAAAMDGVDARLARMVQQMAGFRAGGRGRMAGARARLGCPL